MKLFLGALCICALGIGSMAHAGQPASDRVNDFFQGLQDIQNSPNGADPREVCQVVQRSFEHQQIAMRFLGSYASSPDQTGVIEFRRTSDSIMATKAMPELRKLAGDSGSYSVSPNPTARSSGYFAVSATVKAKGKSYRVVFVVSPNMKIADVEFLGISAISHLGNDFRKDLDKLKQTSNAPVTAYLQDLKAKPGYVDCH